MIAQFDWKKMGWEAANMLSDLIRINTTNPPGNESPACEFLWPRFKELGLDTEVVESASGRGSIIGRLRATDPVGEPLLLLSHLDVVPADDEGWTDPPFSGKIRDGYVYGRGAIDCKNASVVQWYALKAFKEAGHAPRRDIILAATADEEAGGEFGVSFLCEKKPELLDAGFCINEGGGFGFSMNEREIYLCQSAEKGVCWFKLTTTGEPGHASVPGPGSAMDRMIKALSALQEMSPELQVSRTVRRLVEGVLVAMGGNSDAKDLDDDQIAGILLNTAQSKAFKRMLEALIKNTLSITMVHGGSKANVIPGRVEATIDCRIVPGNDPEALLYEIKKITAPFKVEVEPLVASAGTEVEAGGEFYDALEAALKEARPGSAMVPFMVPGGTDGRFLVSRGTRVFGFIPLLAEAGGKFDKFRRAHGIDERVEIKDLAFGIEVLYNLLCRFCSKEAD